MSCELCGFEKATIVHHKDCNHSNNSPDNLQILCWNCHFLTHHPKGCDGTTKKEELILKGQSKSLTYDRSPGICIGCESKSKMDRLYRRVYESKGDKNGKQEGYGWVCKKCGAIRIDNVEDHMQRWVYKGKYYYR